MPSVRRGRRRADPSPSRLRYRLERIWLTPLFRALIRTGIPSFGCVALIVWYIDEPRRIEAIVTTWTDTIEAVKTRPEFMVEQLRVEGASDELAADIAEALPVALPASQFDLDLAGLRGGLLALDPVADAEVRVLSGGVLLLRVTERTPAVAWIERGVVRLLDAEGHRVATVPSLDAAGPLPVIGGEGADAAVPEALRLIAAATPVADRLVGLTRVGTRRWDVVLTEGQRIALPEAAPVAALDRTLALHAAEGVLDREVRVVDLRLPDRPTLRLTRSARDELHRMQDLERLSYQEDR
jgi:cell division protein FtsQ